MDVNLLRNVITLVRGSIEHSLHLDKANGVGMLHSVLRDVFLRQITQQDAANRPSDESLYYFHIRRALSLVAEMNGTSIRCAPGTYQDYQD